MTAVPDTLTTPVEDLLARARAYVTHSHAKNTLAAYAADWKHFSTWCDDHKRRALPASPETILCYIVDLADRYTVATIDRRLSSIGYYHKQARHALPTKDPEVERTMRGIRRAKGIVPNGKTPILTPLLRKMVEALPDDLPGLRDKALLLIGFAGAFRRSELVGLQVRDIRIGDAGLVVTLRRSKTDQEGASFTKGLPAGASETTCPKRALEVWLTTAGITAGPIFRPVDRWGHVDARALSGLGVARAVKRALAAIELDTRDYSGHSLRAGLVTAAAMAGVSERVIMQQTGHKNVAMLRRYIREGSLFRENAAAVVGL
ncbi:MAG TPA: tyrosine-type recombinase/integrase [Roseiflexaceae bacterium]